MTDASSRLSLTEWAVLALLAEHPAHPFAVARRLAPDGDLGHILTVRRPLVYRALDRLVTLDLAAPERTEPGDAGPRRTVHRTTPTGDDALQKWLEAPVEHVRDLRIEFLLKVALLDHAGRTPRRLVQRQRAGLDAQLSSLETLPDNDVATLWRRHNSAAVRAFLEDPFWLDQ